MTYDECFDQYRLDLLADQHLRHKTINGRAFFFSESPDNQLDYIDWQLDGDDCCDALRESGFLLHLRELLNILLVYRSQTGQPNPSQGVLYLNGHHMAVEWGAKASVEALRDAGKVDEPEWL
ncbi:hypothetical protein [Motiliproteus sp. SC1-56]|uniref:hypothetical protein n=1 Tax=Motiliproteus sp. SC1-56 TaxID=2799565 RepID=UPI001A8DD45D|nr:hypothetical protein [Motiliproteus sp. SC1-56]